MTETLVKTQKPPNGYIKQFIPDVIIFLLILLSSLLVRQRTELTTLSFQPWILISAMLSLSLGFAFIKNLLTKYGAVLAGMLVGLIFFLPQALVTLREITQAVQQGGANALSGEAFAIIPFTFLYLAGDLFWGFILGIVQGWCARQWNTVSNKRKWIIGVPGALLIIFLITWLGIFFRKTGKAIAVGCPNFKITTRELALGADGCIMQAALRQKDPQICSLIQGFYRKTCELRTSQTKLILEITQLGISFTYPSHWGDANFREENGITGKRFGVSFCCYDSIEEMVSEGIRIGGATQDFVKPGYGSQGTEFYDFDESTCNLLTAKGLFNAIDRPGLTCKDLMARLQTSLGDVLYFRKGQVGIGIIRLKKPEYKIMVARKNVSTPEKEEEFKNFLRSIESL